VWNARVFTRKTITSRQGILDAVQRVRAEGYAVVDEEFELDLRVALSTRGQMVAALGVATQSTRMSVRRMQDRFLLLLKGYARAVGQLAV
jgi:IclR family transcriptional regulator, pca regulon regulatory protein